MIRTICAALLLLATSALGQVALGPEHAASQPAFAPPAASAAAIATSGDGSLVAFQPAGRNSVFAQLLDANGRPLTEHGIPIETHESGLTRVLAGAASDGKGYEILWSIDGTLFTAHVSLAGFVTEPHELLGGRGTYALVAPRIAASTDGYLVIWVDQSLAGSVVSGLRLDSDGNELGNAAAVTALHSSIDDIELAANGRDYLAAVRGYLPAAGGGVQLDISLVPVDATGHAGSPVRVPFTFNRVFIAATSATTWVVVWAELPNIKAAPVDRLGATGAASVIGQAAIDSQAIESIAGGSSGAIVILRAPNGAPNALRLDSAGKRIDSRTVPEIGFQLVAGITASGQYIAVAQAPDPLTVATIPPGLVDPPPPLSVTPVVTFAVAQQQPRLAVMGEQRVVAWREAGALRATRLRGGVPLDAPPLTISDNAVFHALGSDGTRTLLAWQTRPAGSPPVIQGRFLAADGTLSAPIHLYDVPYDQYGQYAQVDAVVATNGRFVVIWRVRTPPGGGFIEGRLWRAVVAPSGAIVSAAAPLDLAVPGTNAGVQQLDPAVVPTRDGFLLVYDEMVPFPVGSQLRHDLWAAPFHSDGSPAGPRQPVAASLDAEQTPDLATDGNGHVLLVFADTPLLGGPPSIWSLPLHEDGTPAGDAARLGEGSVAHATWTNGTFVVMTADGRILAPVVAAVGALAQPSSVTIAGDTIAYVRSAESEGMGDVDRVYVRTFASGRRRASH